MAALQKLGKSTEEIAKKALYEGANIVADEMRAGIDALPTDESWGTQKNPAKGIREKQKQGLQEGFGISPMQNDNGLINVHVGFSGYNDVKSKKYPSGQPNQMIARVAESGTSFSRKTPFINSAIRKSRKKAEAKMKEIGEEEINKIMKG